MFLCCNTEKQQINEKRFFWIEFIPVTCTDTKNIQKVILHTHSPVPFYQTTNYKTKMQLLIGLYKQIHIYINN